MSYSSGSTLVHGRKEIAGPHNVVAIEKKPVLVNQMRIAFKTPTIFSE